MGAKVGAAELRRRNIRSAARDAVALASGVPADQVRLAEWRRRGGLVSEPSRAPKHVAIVGLGPSSAEWMDLAKRVGGASAFCDEVWGINSLGDVLRCDRIFHMDDVRIQEIRAAAEPTGNIARMLEWMRTHPGPIYTSQVHPDYPGLVEYPLADVLNGCVGLAYLNNTAAAAVAFAIYLGVEQISCFGFDFTYPNVHHAESGRACTEFYLGIAKARGIKIGLSAGTALMDACVASAERIYGYDAVDLTISADLGGRVVTSMVARDVLPTAAEIERRYDHTKHPNPLLRESYGADL